MVLSQLFSIVSHACIFEYCCEANDFSPPPGKLVKGKCKIGNQNAGLRLGPDGAWPHP